MHVSSKVAQARVFLSSYKIFFFLVQFLMWEFNNNRLELKQSYGEKIVFSIHASVLSPISIKYN